MRMCKEVYKRSIGRCGKLSSMEGSCIDGKERVEIDNVNKGKTFPIVRFRYPPKEGILTQQD